MAENQQDRRQDLRVTFRAQARLQFPGARVFNKCETGDISISGVFVAGGTGVECGERCEVEFQLIGRSSTLLLEMAGEVVRVGEDGVGLQFCDVDQDSFCHLQNIVYLNYKQAGLMEVDSDAAVGGVVDETVYLGLDRPRGKSAVDEDVDEYGDGEEGNDDLDQEISERLSYVREDD